MAFYIDGAERARGTQILTRAATYTTFGVNHRDLYRLFIHRIGGHHGYRSGGTVACTVATLHPVGEWYTVVLYPYGMPYLDGRFILPGDTADCSCRTYFRAFRTLGAAISTFVRRFGLHEPFKIGRWTKYSIRTYRYAQLTRGAVSSHIPQSLCSGGNYGCFACRFLLFLYDCQTAVHSLVLGVDGSRSCHSGGHCQELTTGIVHFISLSGSRYRCVAAIGVRDSFLVALLETVEAGDTAGVIYSMCLAVDTCSLAVTGTETASVTLRCVNDRAQKRVA